ncbi:MAG: peptide ABC transporter substrate-binding protein [Leptolyngbya foveolarum]|uniref:Peptide ABC transporter substrate-binding protein n=1 Tax=Leptolyngbya foveolarum TaxID=47253 RepID=A0A2W4U1A0_9CYAN|nr:MAG: peptide ABC transporter substrate-binding protein [Leptolyngbya foveolarum]
MGWQALSRQFQHRFPNRFQTGFQSRFQKSRLGRLLMLGIVIFGLAIALPSCRSLDRLRLENFRTDQSASVPTIISTIIGEPKTFNTLLSAESTSSDVLAMMYTGLLGTDLITGEIVPALAESWNVSEDGKTITYILKENLKWSDGEPLTVDDVVFTYNDLIFNEEIPAGLRDIMRIGAEGKLPTVRKLGDRRIEFKIPEPFAPFLQTTGAAILPKHVLEKTLTTRSPDGQPLFLSTWDTSTDPTKIVGNGPYKIKRFVPGERIVFESNEYYWDTGEDGRQKPYVKELIWPVVTSQDAEFVRFRSGDSDMVSVTPNIFPLVKQDEKQGNYTVYEGGPAASRFFITFNLNKGSLNGKPVVNPVKAAWFNNVSFRQAVAHAIDRQTMLNNLFKGLGEFQNSQIAPQSPYYLPEGMPVPGYPAGLPVYDYDLEAARKLLTDAGFEYRGDQLFDAEGNRVRFTLQTNVGNNLRESAIIQISQNLAQIGIQADTNPIDFNKLIANMDNTLDWDAIVLSFGAGLEPNSSANLWTVNGNSHFFNYQPSTLPPLPGREIADWEQELSNLYVQAAQELDETKRKALYARTQILAQENLPFIHLVGQYSIWAVRNDIENIKPTALAGTLGPLWNVDELELAER